MNNRGTKKNPKYLRYDDKQGKSAILTFWSHISLIQVLFLAQSTFGIHL